MNVNPSLTLKMKTKILNLRKVSLPEIRFIPRKFYKDLLSVEKSSAGHRKWVYFTITKPLLKSYLLVKCRDNEIPL